MTRIPTYVCMITTPSRVWINRVRFAIPLVVSCTGKSIKLFPVPVRVWFRYVCVVITCSSNLASTGMTVADPACGQVNRKNFYFSLSPSAPENSVSRNRGLVILSRGNELILHIHTQEYQS